ncbi:hypothetical protein GCM10011374_29490 [Kocuria dechangensis]|uniref:Alpha/beta hydrolase n=1 Tax=Kocuria dechangensis TaxID=1176249 RepID=A0A917H1R1_9MICC|nr:hypothetical protein [Kocuria dechangensis]GGG64049.1 hypothetical protein GCM10011374_29490 [Kocuria dechangensis]
MSDPSTETRAAYAPCQHESPHLRHFEWESVEAFVDAGRAVEDGLHTIHLPAGPHLDIMLKGRPLDPVHGTACVFFNGAVGNRAKKTAPFLSGAGVSKAVDVPLISVADPSLRLNSELGLAWYMGSEGANAQRPISALLRHMAEVSGNHLVLVGGSGGGFAALHQAQLLGELASALVWNPQTDVLEYSPRLVKLYLEAAFPTLTGRLGGTDWKDLARERMDANGMQSELGSTFADGFRMRRLIWLQNWNDWHTRSHMIPLLNAMSSTREMWPGMIGSDDEHVIWMTEAGEGHAPPPAEAVQTLLADMVRSDSSSLSTAKWAAAQAIFPREFEKQYVRDLRPFRSPLQTAVEFVFVNGQKLTPKAAKLDSKFGGLRFKYELVGTTAARETKYGGLGSTYVVPDEADWDYLIVSALDGFDHELFSARFLNQGG